MSFESTLPILTAIGGFLATHLWQRFQNRVTHIRYWVVHNYLGSSVDDKLFGTVKISHNGNEVNSLHMTTLSVENPSSRDINDIKVVLYCDADSFILVSHASKKGSISDITFDKGFLDLVASKVDPKLHTQRRDYRIPVLNRGEQVNFSFLVTNAKGNTPYFWLSCEHVGVKAQEIQLLPRIWGEPRSTVAFAGSLCAMLLSYPLYRLAPKLGWE